MSVERQVDKYLASLAGPAREDMTTLHQTILGMAPACKLWFMDGTDGKGKTVSNPNIGYGAQSIEYADGRARDFYRVGISANTTGVSVYIMGIKDKTYLAQTYAHKLGKAKVTGYCIKFRRLRDIDPETLRAALRDGLQASST